MINYSCSELELRIFVDTGWTGWVQIIKESTVDEFRIYKLRVYHTIEKSPNFGSYPIGYEFWYRNYRDDPDQSWGYFDKKLEDHYSWLMKCIKSDTLAN